MYTGRELQARLSFAFKSIFWVCTAVLGFLLTWLAPSLSAWLIAGLVGFTLMCVAASIGLDIARGGNVLLWTLIMVVGGAVILGIFYWIYFSFAIAPAQPLFNFAVATPTP
jgi:hypothetical protein